jgi:hypothetical protein
VWCGQGAMWTNQNTASPSYCLPIAYRCTRAQSPFPPPRLFAHSVPVYPSPTAATAVSSAWQRGLSTLLPSLLQWCTGGTPYTLAASSLPDLATRSLTVC